MDAAYQAECERRTGDELYAFLLDTSNIYARYVEHQQIVTTSEDPKAAIEAGKVCQSIFEEFQSKYQGVKQNVVRIVPEHLYTCRNCGCAVIRYIALEAVRVCTRCGLQKAVPFEDEYKMNAKINERPPTKKFEYKPDQHLQKWIYDAQGFFSKAFSARLLHALRADLNEHGVSDVNITPEIIKRSLKRIGKTKLYDNSYVLTCMFNKAYIPLRISDRLEEQLQRIFQQCYLRFTMYEKNRKNFVKYPFFLSYTLTHLGYPEKAAYFETYKSRADRERYSQMMCHLLRDIHIESVCDLDVCDED